MNCLNSTLFLTLFPPCFSLPPRIMKRILSIDYGKRRTGIAVTDPLQIIAGGLTTVDTRDVLKFLTDYVRREPVETIVVGLPVQPNGAPSENQSRVRCFTGELKKALPEVEVVFYDERYTSVMAHQAMLQSGIGRKRRRDDKGLVDEISATIILQNFLEYRRLKH